MENKYQNDPNVRVTSTEVPLDFGVVREQPDPNALSSAPASEPIVLQEKPKGQANVFLRFVRRVDVVLAVILLIAGGVVAFSVTRADRSNSLNTTTADRYDTVQISLNDLISGKDLSLAGGANVTINGPIQLNDALYLAPQLQPTGARAGQIYYDKSTNQLAYFNGEVFVFLTSSSITLGDLQSLSRVESIGGATGQLTIGNGLSLNNGQLSNSGVLSFQGQNGDVTLTAGAGIVINGTSFSNSGVLSVSAGTPNVTVGNDGNGNITLSVAATGSGTITSSGGTIGTVPIYTASQNIENSIITQSGLTVTVNGDLSIVTGGLSLSNALTVSNGGTGATSLAGNGVLVGNGTAAVGSVAAGSAGLCLLSTAGAPTWGACTAGGGVASLNSLTGALSIANASAAGSTVTIDDASTVNKGIASFNSTNFTAASGAINTVQNINTAATPTFAGVNTNNITPSAALTVGAVAQTALLQGSTATITSNGAGNDIVLNSADTIELQDATNITGNLTVSGDIAANGGDITSTGALNITPTGALTVGVSSQTLTLQGGASTTLRATSGASTTTVGFAIPTANVTLNFPALAAGTYTICTSNGECAGTGSGVTSAGGTTNRLSKFTGPQAIGDSTITDDGTNVTTSVDAIIQGGDLTIGTASQIASIILHDGNGQTTALQAGDSTGNLAFILPTNTGVANQCLKQSGTGNQLVWQDCDGGSGGSSATLQTAYDNSTNPEITLNGSVGGLTIRDNVTPLAANLFEIQNSTGATTYFDVTASGADIAGDLAVNGGDITSTGALNITPAGTLTVGVTGQQLILQGNANTQLTATGGGYTTTIGFVGTPVGALTYNFDRSAVAGTYNICTSIGNCAGAGGGVTTSGGTTGTIPKFTGPQTLGNSLLSESGTTMTVNGNLNLIASNQYQIGGSQISSANLSNDSNLAKLSASQTFTGNTVAFQNGLNSTNAFNIQNAGGTRILTVDTSNGLVTLGVGSALDGKLVFSNVSNGNTVTILPGTPSANRTLTLPDASGIICTDSGNCAGAGATLQTSYNFSVGGTTPKIKVNSTLLGVDIQDADTTISANLFNVRASNAVGLGSVMFGVGSTGAVTFQNSANSTTAFRLLTQGGTSVLTGDTTNGQIILGQSGTLSGGIVFNNATNLNTTTIALTTPSVDRTITLPNATGIVCLDSGNCSGAGSSNTLQAAYDAGNTITTSDSRNISFALADTATDSNYLIDLQCDIACGSNGRFALQDDGVDVFSVSPAGGAIAIQPTVDSTTAFNMKSSLNDNLFTIDSVNSRLGFGLGGSNLPTLTGSGGFELKGAIRLSAASSVYADSYTTPLGASASTMINILNYNPGANGQLIAMGLPSTADVTSRGIALFDARSGTHQPTIAVLSPNETNIGGFSWDGSNDEFRVKNSNASGSIALNLGGTNQLTATSTGVGINMTPNALYKLDVNGDVNIISGAAYRINGVAICTSSGCIPAAGSANYIQNQSASQQAASAYWISGTGRADTSLQAPLLDTATGVALNIGTTNATAINLNQNVTVAATKTLTVTSGLTDLTANTSGDALNVSNSTSTGNIAVFKDGSTAVATIANGGVTTFQNSTDSTGAFRVLSSTGGSLFSIDSTNGGTATLLGMNSGETGSWSSGATTLTGTRGYAGTAIANGYAYVVGGNSGTTPQATVYYAKINSNGTTGSWTTSTYALPVATAYTTATAQNGYLYVLGGSNSGGTEQTTVYFTRLNSDGSTGSWYTTTALPAARSNGKAVSVNGYMYYIGGQSTTDTAQNTTYYSKINSDGTLGAWTAGSTITSTRKSAQIVTANGYIYVAGGVDNIGNYQTSVYYATLDPNTGAIGTFASTNSLPGTRAEGSALIANGYMYVIGGRDTSTYQTSVYYSKLSGSDGTAGAWATATNALPATRGGSSSFIANGYMYMIGGYDGSTTTTNTVYSSSVARVQIGASLDLVGLQTANMTTAGDTAQGSAGGSITAGNGTFIGTMQVQGMTNLSQGLNVNGITTLTGNTYVAGTLSLSSELAAYEGFENVTFPPSGGTGTWTTGGDVSWSRDTVNYEEGIASAASGTILDNQSGWLDVDYTWSQAGSISFAWNVSSEVNYDNLVVCIDKDSTCSRTTDYSYRINGESGWQQLTIPMTAGTHSIRWLYGKDGSTPAGSDKGWVDNVRFNGGEGKIVGNGINFSPSAGYNVTIGDNDANAALLVLDNSTNSSDPTGVNGGMYYSTYLSKLRCFEANGWHDCAGGNLGYSSVTTAQGGITAAVDLTGFTVDAVVPSSHRVRVSAELSYASTVAGDAPGLSIYEDGVSVYVCNIHLVRANESDGIKCDVILQPTPGLHTYKLRGYRAGGTGTISTNVAAGAPGYIMVEDIGGQ